MKLASRRRTSNRADANVMQVQGLQVAAVLEHCQDQGIEIPKGSRFPQLQRQQGRLRKTLQSIQNPAQRFIARDAILIEDPGKLTCFKSEMK